VPTGPILAEFWRDVVSLGSAIITIASLIYAIRQIRRAESAATAARSAAVETLENSRRSFQRFAPANAIRFSTEANAYVEGQMWDRAALRVGDLADQAAQLAEREQDWKVVIEELRGWEVTLKRIARGKAKFLPPKWDKTLRSVQMLIDAQHGPFK
jgi:hypothetical protein